MTKNKLQLWFRAIRPFAFTGSVMPVAAGAIVAAREGVFYIGYFILSLFAIVFLHSAVNLLSDYDDYMNKVDTAETYGSSGVLVENLLRPRQILIAGCVFLALDSLLGIYLTITRGMFILYLGILGALGGYFYTGKPLALKYKGLGLPLVFLLFGPLMTIGGYYVQAQRISLSVILVSIPLGLLTTAILHANDMRDIFNDKKAGIKTLSILIGESPARKVYLSLIFIPYIFVLIMVYYKFIPLWSLFCLITLPSAVKKAKKLSAPNAPVTDLLTFDKETAELHAKFGAILILTMLLF